MKGQEGYWQPFWRMQLRPRLGLMAAGLAAALLLALAACGEEEEAPATPTATPAEETATPTAAPAAAELIIAIPNTPPRADPPTIDQFIEHELIVNIYDRLFEFQTTEGPEGTKVMVTKGIESVEPALAESWEISDDRRTYTIHLRQGVKSNFGNELTSEDVRWTIERTFAAQLSGTFYYGAIDFPGIENFEVVDKYTFKMTTANPNVLFFRVMALPHQGILDSTEGKKHATTDDPWATEWFKTNSAGFGPYQISEWSPGQQVVLTANPNYWKGPPPIPKVIMREVPESANRLSLLQEGAVDIAENLTARERQTLEGAADIKVYSFEPGHQFSWFAMTNTIEPFDDPKVRQAVCYAIPYQELIDTVTLGTGRIQKSPLNAPYEFYNPALSPYTTDLDKAKQLLAEAGFPNGFQTTLGFSSANPEDEQTAVIIRAGLAKVGIDVILEKQPFATYVEKWLGAQYPATTAYAGAIVPDAAYAIRLWWYSKNNILDFTKYSNSEVDDLLDQLRQEFDDVKRKEITDRLQQLILEDAPMCYLIEPGIHYPARANVRGIGYFTDSALRYYDITK